MALFKVEINDKVYDIEFTRDSVRQIEALGITMEDMETKIYLTIDALMQVGLSKHNPHMTANLAKKISDSAIEEYGAGEVYSELIEKYMEVFMAEGKSKKKSFLMSQKTKKTEPKSES